MSVSNKAKIIEAIQQTDDEWVLLTTNRLFQTEEEEVPEWHKEVLNGRLKDIEEGKAVFHDREEVKRNFR